MMTTRMIYVHIPFCDSKCYYCDFVSAKYSDDIKREYFQSLKKEIKKYSSSQTKISSIFIGGGTPSSVDVSYICEIINTIKQNFDVQKDAEITIEANPCSVDKTKLLAYKKSGINRISFGVQSFDDELLKTIGRRHSSSQAKNAINLAQQVGFDNINADLLLGLPGQTYNSLELSVNELLSLPVTHISAYMLINEEGTVLTKKIEKGELQTPTEEDCVLWYDKMLELLQKNGFERYEVSNFAKSGYECKHNLGYWQTKQYYGVGLSAHGYIDGIRYSNTTNIKKYISGGFVENTEKLTSREKIEEKLFLGLRTKYGVNINELKKLGCDITKNDNLKSLMDGGFVRIDENIAICDDKFAVMDSIVLKLLEKI